MEPPSNPGRFSCDLHRKLGWFPPDTPRGDAVVDRRTLEVADDPGALDRGAMAVVTYLDWEVSVLRHGPTGTVIAFIDRHPRTGRRRPCSADCAGREPSNRQPFRLGPTGLDLRRESRRAIVLRPRMCPTMTPVQDRPSEPHRFWGRPVLTFLCKSHLTSPHREPPPLGAGAHVRRHSPLDAAPSSAILCARAARWCRTSRRRSQPTCCNLTEQCVVRRPHPALELPDDDVTARPDHEHRLEVGPVFAVRRNDRGYEAADAQLPFGSGPDIVRVDRVHPGRQPAPAPATFG